MTVFGKQMGKVPAKRWVEIIMIEMTGEASTQRGTRADAVGHEHEHCVYPGAI